MITKDKEPSLHPYDAAEAIVLGHGRLVECYETAGGNAAAVTYILIDPEHRGNGYGRLIMCLLEREALSNERLGCEYHFIYLWCKVNKAPFYERSGYLPIRNRVSLQRPCLKNLTATGVQTLEDILQLRCHRRNHTGSVGETNKESNINYSSKKKIETIMLLSSSKDDGENKTDNFLGEDEPVEEDVWLRKRLVDHVESSTHISKQDRIDQMKKFIANHDNIPFTATSTTTKWYYRWNADVPWQQQIGPSCGLTAIRMVKDFYFWSEQSRQQEEDEDNVDDEQQQQQCRQKESPPSPSLLLDAQERGYTQDGEIFDVDHLRELMEDQLVVTGGDNFGLDNEMSNLVIRTREISSLTIEEIDYTLKQGGLWILPYDSNPRTKLPGKFQGKHAHWGILVGILYSARTEAETHTTTTVNVIVEEGKETVMDGSLAKKEEREKGNTHRIDRFPRPLLLPLKEDGQIHTNCNTDASDYSSNWCVQHSLASQWCIAPMDDWIKSNQQLISINDQKFTLLNGERDLNLQNRIIQVFPRSYV